MGNEKKNGPVKVLQVSSCGGGNFGGVQHFLYEYCSHINEKKVKFDYLYLNKRPGNAGSFNKLLDNTNVYELDVLNIQNIIKKFLLMYRKTRIVIEKGDYDVIHINVGQIHTAMFVAYVARAAHVPVRIVHAHAVHASEKKIAKIGTKLFRGIAQKSIWKNSTHQFTCSEKAGNSIFGNTKQLKNYRIIKNAVKVEKFRYLPKTRSEVREAFGVGSDKIIITVGSLMGVKNHSFLIDIFNVISKKDEKVRLWIVGGGELKDVLQAKIDSLHLSGRATLLGARNDVDKLLQAADLYVCPSFSEGLSLAVVEAQTSGIKVLASDGISKEHRITDLIEFLPLDAGENKWASEIMRLLNEEYVREDKYQEIVDAGYEINAAAKWLEEFYISAVKEVQ